MMDSMIFRYDMVKKFAEFPDQKTFCQNPHLTSDFTHRWSNVMGFHITGQPDG